MCHTVHFPLAGTSDYSTTSGPSSTPSQSFTINIQSLSPSPTSGGISVGPKGYVLPAAISVVAMLLVVVVTAILVVIICSITCMQTQDSEVKQHATSLASTTQSSADVPIHDEKAAVDTNHNNVIRDAPRSNAALAPSEFNDNIV